jgi:hypothetical protein
VNEKLKLSVRAGTLTRRTSAIAMKSARATNFRPGSYWKELFPIDIVHSSSFLMNFTVLDRNAFTLHAVS